MSTGATQQVLHLFTLPTAPLCVSSLAQMQQSLMCQGVGMMRQAKSATVRNVKQGQGECSTCAIASRFNGQGNVDHAQAIQYKGKGNVKHGQEIQGQEIQGREIQGQAPSLCRCLGNLLT